MVLFSAAKFKTQVGVEFQPAGVAVAVVDSTKNSTGSILRGDFLSAIGQEDQVLALQAWVRQERLQKHPCICLMAPEDVDVLQVEKPKVDESEMAQALSWRVKDLLSYDLSQAVIESYPMPVSSKNNTEQVSVVTARESVVRSYIDAIDEAELKLLAIDTQDLVIQRLQAIQQSEGQSLAVLLLDDNAGKLLIHNDGDLHVARAFKIGVKDLEKASSEDQGIYDSLLLEIQRSMDYFESYYGLGSVSNLRIFPQIPMTEKMALYLQNLTNFDIDFLTMNGEEDDVPSEIPDYCFLAYCAALRGIAH